MKPYWVREGTQLQLSKSGAECFQRCPREFHNRYCLELEPRGHFLLADRGTAWGNAVAAWWNSPLSDNTSKHVRRMNALAALRCDAYKRLPIAQQTILVAAVEVYDKVYSPMGAPTATGAEVEVAGVLKDGLGISRGFADVVVDRENKPRVVVEVKATESEIGEGSWFLERLKYDAQVAGYWNADPSCRIVYDIFRVPNLKPQEATPPDKQAFYVKGSRDGKFGPGAPKPGIRLKEESMEEFHNRVVDFLDTHRFTHFLRHEVVATETHKEQLFVDLTAIARQVTTAAAFDEWPRNSRSCRRGKLGDCGFFGSCYGDLPLEVNQVYGKRTRH